MIVEFVREFARICLRVQVYVFVRVHLFMCVSSLHSIVKNIHMWNVKPETKLIRSNLRFQVNGNTITQTSLTSL